MQCEIYYNVPVFMLMLNQSDMTYSEDFLCLFWNFVVGAFGFLKRQNCTHLKGGTCSVSVCRLYGL